MKLNQRIEMSREALKSIAEFHMPIWDAEKINKALAALPEPMTEDEIEDILYPILFENFERKKKLLTHVGYEIVEALKSAGVLLVREG